MATQDKKVLTSEEIFQQQRQLEDDLARLQRQYRILERDRDNFQNQTGKGSKVKNVLSNLKKEEREIITDLNVAASEANARRDNKIVLSLGEQLAQYHEFQNKIAEEKSYIHELEIQIIIASKRIQKLSGKQVTDIQLQSRVLNGQKTLESQENKLEIAVRRFCVVQAGNKQLRYEINHLLIERTGFNKLFEKLILNLTMGKKFMMDLIEQATIAYDQREEWCSKLQALKLRANIGIVTHSQECQYLEHQIDNETTLANFLTTKSQKRIMRQILQKENMKRQKIRMEMETLITDYKQILDKIKEFCHETNLDDVCEKFIKDEEEIFAMFQYVNDLNRQMEKYSDELGILQLQIADQRNLNSHRARTQEARLKLLDTACEQTKEFALLEEQNYKKTEAECARLLIGIHRLFELSKCQTTPFIDLLGNNAQISNFNALLYLEELEIRVNDLIKLVYYREKVIESKRLKELAIDDRKIHHLIAGVEVIVTTTPCPLCIEQEHVNDVVDKLQFAMNRHAIERLIKSQMRISGTSHIMHNVSACNLPKSREIIQRRYQ